MDTLKNDVTRADLSRCQMVAAWESAPIALACALSGSIKSDHRVNESALRRFWRRACNR